MKLYVEPMDTVVVEVDPAGHVRYQNDSGQAESSWHLPTLQERRAIIYAARTEVAQLEELVDILEKVDAPQLFADE